MAIHASGSGFAEMKLMGENAVGGFQRVRPQPKGGRTPQKNKRTSHAVIIRRK
jgi:hypothetical protein